MNKIIKRQRCWTVLLNHALRRIKLENTEFSSGIIFPLWYKISHLDISTSDKRILWRSVTDISDVLKSFDNLTEVIWGFTKSCQRMCSRSLWVIYRCYSRNTKYCFSLEILSLSSDKCCRRTQCIEMINLVSKAWVHKCTHSIMKLIAFAFWPCHFQVKVRLFMLLSVSECFLLSTLFLVFITCIFNSSAFFQCSWFQYVKAQIDHADQCEGCSSSKTAFWQFHVCLSVSAAFP